MFVLKSNGNTVTVPVNDGHIQIASITAYFCSTSGSKGVADRKSALLVRRLSWGALHTDLVIARCTICGRRAYQDCTQYSRTRQNHRGQLIDLQMEFEAACLRELSLENFKRYIKGAGTIVTEDLRGLIEHLATQ